MQNQNIHNLAKDTFHINSLKAEQVNIINQILSNQNSAAIFPTGSGKSLCYQLPSQILPGLTLVISPLLALMKDQMDYLNSLNISCGSINSTQSSQENSTVRKDVLSGKIKILYVSVEKLKNHSFLTFIKKVNISLIAVDEAHCVSAWGHNFRPDYLVLPTILAKLNNPTVLLLTATATTEVIYDMQNVFNITAQNTIITNFYRDNLKILIHPITQDKKQNVLLNYLLKYKDEPTIIYTIKQKDTEDLNNYLCSNGINSAAFHAGLKPEIKEQLQNDFLNDNTTCMVATIAFGMGINKSNIRHVIHYDLPKSLENYAQEIGRAARDGKDANCLVLANTSRVNTMENFIYGDTPQLNEINIVLDDITQNINTKTNTYSPSIYALSHKSNIRQLTLKTLLVYLELNNILTYSHQKFTKCSFKINSSIEEALAFLDLPNRQTIFNNILNKFDKKTTKYHFIQNTESTLDIASNVIDCLSYLHDNNHISVEFSASVESYNVNNINFDKVLLGQILLDKFTIAQDAQITKINSMIHMLSSNSCISRQLSNYFNKNSMNEDCGSCSVCMNKYKAWIKEDELKISIINTSDFEDKIQEHYNTEVSDILKTKFLCGIITPWISKSKAKQLNGFESLEHNRFKEVLEVISNN